ncbi:MAG: DUF4054 domain-containing protein [Lentilactobacillus hilgardii]|uniref:DUF4054 domain-containing protein n=1 Tax=Lentilactobacillus hilgardii TaxID=1588 RepID=UPI001CC1D711|nr:DUF4054 domain-containing protein [Lentilactobacillus hilgardii]MBZ2200520.1 hypothetical protein [Lentilactobacillus hilgardii]MBZ2204604.1 hypothetical protein [Lentilactobacillus hilgardii]
MAASQALTTIDRLKSTAPDLVSDLTDDTLTMYISDAHIDVLGDGFPDHIQVGGEDIGNNIKEQAERYLALHLASMDNEAGRGIQSEQVDVLKTTYFSKSMANTKWINSSIWGRMFWDLWKQYGKGDTFNVIVVNH